MKIFSRMTRDELLGISLKEYFDCLENGLQKDVDLDWLTGIFSESPYQERKPYLTRRILLPKDERFKEIEIVYDTNDSNKVKAIIWVFNITLRELVGLFGEPILHYEPYSDSTVFAFNSKNPDIDIIKTRFSNDKRELKELKLLNVTDTGSLMLNLEFTFLQFNLKDS